VEVKVNEVEQDLLKKIRGNFNDFLRELEDKVSGRLEIDPDELRQKVEKYSQFKTKKGGYIIPSFSDAPFYRKWKEKTGGGNIFLVKSVVQLHSNKPSLSLKYKEGNLLDANIVKSDGTIIVIHNRQPDISKGESLGYIWIDMTGPNFRSQVSLTDGNMIVEVNGQAADFKFDGSSHSKETSPERDYQDLPAEIGNTFFTDMVNLDNL